MSDKAFARPSALAPLLMSLAALVVVLARVVVGGTAREADEGLAAHLFQVLIVGQLPIVAFFAVKWLRRTSRSAWVVLGAQVGAILIACAPVFCLRW